jgi:hypothetical protein
MKRVHNELEMANVADEQNKFDTLARQLNELLLTKENEMEQLSSPTSDVDTTRQRITKLDGIAKELQQLHEDINRLSQMRAVGSDPQNAQVAKNIDDRHKQDTERCQV